MKIFFIIKKPLKSYSGGCSAVNSMQVSNRTMVIFSENLGINLEL